MLDTEKALEIIAYVMAGLWAACSKWLGSTKKRTLRSFVGEGMGGALSGVAAGSLCAWANIGFLQGLLVAILFGWVGLASVAALMERFLRKKGLLADDTGKGGEPKGEGDDG
jgi:hypothetical protein